MRHSKAIAILTICALARVASAVRPDAVSEGPTGQQNVEVLNAANQNTLPTPATNYQRWLGNNSASVTPAPTPAADECVLSDETTGSSTDAFTLRCKTGLYVKSLRLLAGTATAGTAPLYFTSGTLLTDVEPGALERANNSLYYTNWYVRRSVVQGQEVLTSDVTVANTTTETTVYTQPHGANYLQVGKQEDILLLGTINSLQNGNTNTLTLRVKYAGATQATFVVPEASRSGIAVEIHVVTTVRAIGSGTTSIQIHGNADVYGTTSDPVVNTLATGLDSTTAQPTTVTVQWSDADAGNSVTFSQGRALSIDDNP